MCLNETCCAQCCQILSFIDWAVGLHDVRCSVLLALPTQKCSSSLHYVLCMFYLGHCNFLAPLVGGAISTVAYPLDPPLLSLKEKVPTPHSVNGNIIRSSIMMTSHLLLTIISWLHSSVYEYSGNLHHAERVNRMCVYVVNGRHKLLFDDR